MRYYVKILLELGLCLLIHYIMRRIVMGVVEFHTIAKYYD
jgi:hypothetical protein